MHKSCGGVSLVEQDTIENVSVAYLKLISIYIKNLSDFGLHCYPFCLTESDENALVEERAKFTIFFYNKLIIFGQNTTDRAVCTFWGGVLLKK
jgi:hypothetical protein